MREIKIIIGDEVFSLLKYIKDLAFSLKKIYNYTNYISSIISDLIFIIFDFYYKDHSNNYYCEFENFLSKNFLLKKTDPFMLNKTK